MNTKYVPKSTRKSNCPNGRPVNPDNWVTGPCPIRRDKYYAWLKHRNQERYLGREYNLTWEDWESVWTDACWAGRGRGSDNLCLARLDSGQPWSLSNVQVMTRREQLQIPRQYKRKKT